MGDDKAAAQGDTGLGLDEEDRLPWLEAAEEFEDDREVSPVRLLVMVLGGLILIGAVLGGLWWIQNGGSRTKSELILAEKGDYKVAPESDGAKTFEGEGDASFAASEGVPPAAKVDPSRMPEEPAVTPADREAAAKAKDAAKAKKVEPAKAPPSPAPAKAAPAKAETAKAATGGAAPATGGMIQLGAFSSEAAANKAWTNLSKRFAYLGELNRSISPAKVESGTVYRLRVSAGSASKANDLCGKLRVAGENCVVVR